MNSSLKLVVQLQDEYINLLGAELDEMSGLMIAHGWQSTRYEEGKRLREEIKKAKEESFYINEKKK